MEETIFYQNGSIKVTQSRFIVENKTYAMRNISSVYIGVITPNRLPGILFLIIGILIAISEQGRALGVIIAIIAAVYIFFLKDKFSVRISTNAGETNGVISTDRRFVENIVQALNEAIIHQ
jgi:hypothetical protein